MVEISYTFDEEMGRNGIDPLGTLTVSDGRSAFVIDTTYLDSWFSGLVGAFSQVAAAGYARVEGEEPIPIEIRHDGERLAISYGSATVFAANLGEFEEALKETSRRFLDDLKDLPDAPRNSTLDPVRSFLAAASG